MKHIKDRIVEKINHYESITIGYIRNSDTKLEVGLTSYMDDVFVMELYTFIGSVLYDCKTHTVKITVVDVDDGIKNPLDAVVTIEL